MTDQSGPSDNRPPNKPPSGPPPPSPPQGAGHQPPARRDQDARSQESSAVATNGGPGFTTPQPLGPPRFAEGEHRLVGRVGPPAQSEAEALALLMAAATRPRPSRPGNPRPHGGQPLNPAHATRPRQP